MRSVWSVTGRKHIIDPTESEVKFAKASKAIEELGFLTPGDVASTRLVNMPHQVNPISRSAMVRQNAPRI